VSRTIVISDIHGYYHTFVSLLEQIEYVPEVDQLVLLGDYVDGGKYSLQVIDFVRQLVDSHTTKAIGGNHDDMFLNWLDRNDYRLSPYTSNRNGGQHTIRSFCPWYTNERDDEKARAFIKECYSMEIEFLHRLPDYYEDMHRIYVHAGINPQLSDWKQTSHKDFRWIRGKFHTMDGSICIDRRIVFGHEVCARLHQTDTFVPWFGQQMIGIDGGGKFGYQLNALIISEELVLVHRRELMDQWRERLSAFLNIDKKNIGIIGGGKDKRTGIVDIAIIQSLNYKGAIKEYLEEYGQIIVDECHHVSAFSFEQVLKKAKAKYVMGLTATPSRKDGHQPIVLMQCGPIRINIDAKSQAQARGMEQKVIPRYTTFRMPTDLSSPGIQDIYKLLVDDEERNSMIFDDLLKALDEGRSPILLTERTAHVEYFENRLRHFAKNVIVLRGGMGKKQREALREQIASISDSEERVFIATGKLIGEGFDDARLDTLFLVHPISWKGTLQQYAGRLHRNHPNKRDVQIYDYVDLQVPMLMAMYKKRVKGYAAMGYHGMSL
jgi:hypothetical protein